MYRWFWKSWCYFFFAGKTYNGAFRGAPSKNPKKCPIICFAPAKKIISRTFKIRGALVFLCPKEKEERREKKEERRETRDERRAKREERRETRDERRETRDERQETSEQENKSEGDYISKLPRPKWKIRQILKERYSMYLTLPRDS